LIDEVLKIDIKNKKINGIYTKANGLIKAKYIIITTGTYMESKTFSGFDFKDAGPVFDFLDKNKKIQTEVSKRSNSLSMNLRDLGFTTIRLKTGTPPRIYQNTIDLKKLDKHPGTKTKLAFEHFNPTYVPFDKQVIC
jgi:tRNA uridine 5-carboxymethylaminomethyl modification enzyme